jgi:L,D-peptidoglycan transpeptidase YkuD (ErfK/YbiS/YcfS/YnhG family)
MTYLFNRAIWLIMGFVAGTVGQAQSLPIATRQLLVVRTESRASSAGNLQRYQLVGRKWQATGEPILVSVGRNGLAWGRGIYRDTDRTPAKSEGDGRAPAGIFRLGPAFGYAPRPPSGCTFPYRAITDRDYFVDAPASADYNRWITIPTGKPNQPEKLWPSVERMKRPDRLYEFGIVVQQNDRPVVKGKGSAIFLHVWRKPGVPTVGCTAMARDDLLALLRWLEPEQHPLLVQAPENEINNILSFRLAQ